MWKGVVCLGIKGHSQFIMYIALLRCWPPVGRLFNVWTLCSITCMHLVPSLLIVYRLYDTCIYNGALMSCPPKPYGSNSTVT